MVRMVYRVRKVCKNPLKNDDDFLTFLQDF